MAGRQSTRKLVKAKLALQQQRKRATAANKKTVDIKQESDDSAESSSQAIPAAALEATKVELLEHRFKVVQDLHYMQDTAVLERAVEAGVELARELLPFVSELALLNTSSTARKDDGLRWKNAIEEILSLQKPTRTTIGVVGATGSGKSSLVNALLGEEKLLPTSCTKACTAWITEVSYNYSNDENATYKAEIEFVKEDEWLKEIDTALNSVKDEINSGSTDYSSPNTEAGLAFLRLNAVYPGITPQMIASSERNAFMENAGVQKYIGRTINLADVTAKGLYDQMQLYMGRNTQAKDGNDMNPWPMIRVVRVFTKAPALSTGAVIADLPGIQDANAARAAVSSKYMKDCSGIWIVAPIMRAVDDKSAKDLLGESFRYQMLLDNRYSAISFICSKTDDIKIDEAAGELDLNIDIQSDLSKITSLAEEIPALESELKAAKKQKYQDAEALSECRDELERLEEALCQIQGGQSLGAVTANLGKRQRADDNTCVADAFAGTCPGSSFSEREQVEQRQHDLRGQLQHLRERSRIAIATARTKEKSLDTRLQERKLLRDKIKEACIEKRNSVSTERIKQDFADGIKELDKSNALDKNDVFYSQEKNDRDYQKIKANLPVFCVSSQAFQKLNGMMQNEDFNTSGYKGIDDTGLPRLQAHTQKLTEADRKARCRQILTKLRTLLVSIACWVTGHDLKQAGFDARTVEEHLGKEADKLLMNWRIARESSSRNFSACLRTDIYSKASDPVARAKEDALGLADVWFANPKYGGFSTVTFKAICKKQGVHTARGRPPIDLHHELTKPIKQCVSQDWTRVFRGHLPIILTQYNSELLKYQHQFHQAIMNKYESNGNMSMALNLLDNCTGTSTETAAILSVKLTDTIDSFRDKAVLAMVPPIADAMSVLYRSGSKARMKEMVESHISNIQKTVFRDSVDAMLDHLRDMERSVTNKMKAEVDKAHDSIYRDYSNALLSGTQSVELSPVELELKNELTIILNNTNSRFRTEQEAAGMVGGGS